METFFRDLGGLFHELHAEIARSVDGLAGGSLDWSPGPDMNSITVLVVHLLGAERYWIEAVALEEPTDRVRAEEFLVSGLGSEALKDQLHQEDLLLDRLFERFSISELEQNRTSPRNNRSFTVGWCLSHALEHTALHVGQIQLTRQLWEQQEQAGDPASR